LNMPASYLIVANRASVLFEKFIELLIYKIYKRLAPLKTSQAILNFIYKKVYELFVFYIQITN